MKEMTEAQRAIAIQIAYEKAGIGSTVLTVAMRDIIVECIEEFCKRLNDGSETI